MLSRGRGVPARAEPRRATSRSSARTTTPSPTPSAVRHADQGPEPGEHRVRQQLHRGRLRRRAASTTCSPTRPSASSGRRSRRPSATSTTSQGFDGRFGAGLPRINDGSLLFLQHMISKMKPVEGRRQPHRHRLQRLAAVHRRRRLRRERDPPLDHRERLARGHRRACPTSSSTTPASAPTSGSSPTASAGARRARSSSSTPRDLFAKMRKSLGNKRNELIADDHIAEITALYGDVRPRASSSQDLRQRGLRLPPDHGRAPAAAELPGRRPSASSAFEQETAFQNLLEPKKGKDGEPRSRRQEAQQAISASWTLEPPKVWKNRTVPEATSSAALKPARRASSPPAVKKAILSALSERDETADICIDPGQPRARPRPARLRERAAQGRHPRPTSTREVLPHVPDAWIDESARPKVGYEIPFTRHFYKYSRRARWRRSRPTSASWRTRSGMLAR